MKNNFFAKICVALLLGASAQFAMALTVDDRADITKPPKTSCSITCPEGSASCSADDKGCTCECV